MNNIPVSLFLGTLFLAALFVLCTVADAGIKILYLYLKRSPIKFKPEKSESPRPKISAKPQKAQKPIRSIEINPEEVDKIYVKKVS